MTDYDSIYHRLFGHDGMVAALLREFVPQSLLDGFDLDGITPENAKFHAHSGKRRDGDTAWRIPRRDGGETYLLLLLEFQSRVASRMALRILVYAGLVWQHLERQKRLLPGGRLPPVLPIVLYRGKSRWRAPLSLRTFVGLPAGSPLWEWQPDMRYYIIDQRRFGEADLVQRDGILPLLFRLETAASPDQLVSVDGALRSWFKVNPAPETLRMLFIELMRGAMEPLAPGVLVPNNLWESENVLAAEVEAWKRQLTQQARKEGRQEGLQKGRQEGEEIGEQRGHRKGELALLLRLLERRFGPLPAWVRERVSAAETAALEAWGLRVLDAESLDDVFA
jgi:hypothetical protein